MHTPGILEGRSPASLPRYRRNGPTFRDLFGAAPADVLASMDAAGDDIPNAAPACPIRIEQVGLRRTGIVVGIDDPFGGESPVHAVCTLHVAAGVPVTRRGVHMSRIGHAVAESSAGTYRGIGEYTRTLARTIADAQYGQSRVTVHARVPYVEESHADRPSADRAGRGKLSLEHLHLVSRHTIDDDQATTDLGLRVTHLLACPCVQQTYRHARLVGRGAGLDESHIEPPLMTHSQRCVTTVIVRGVAESHNRSPVAMLAALDGVLVRTCNTLPRAAELSCVYRAHRRPQFIEDALRAAVLAIADVWAPPAAYRCITGRSKSIESIHEHDLTASLTLNAGERRSMAGAP
jgi:GTP cyclohydrolase FolE2